METSRKRRGFMKLKMMMPIYKAVKHSSSKPPQKPGYVLAHQQQPKPQKVSVLVSADANNMISREKKLSMLTEKLFGAAALNVDGESVDLKAASYISSRMERFNGD